MEVDARDKDGWTALIWAAWKGHLDIVKYLAEQGADLSVKDNKGDTASMIARKNNYKEVADYLDPLTQFKKRMESIVKGDNDNSELKPGIRGMLRTGKGQEYSIAKHGVSYVV